MNQMGKDVMAVRKEVLGIEKLSRHYYKKAFCSLVRYYYDNFESELLDEALEELDWDMVNVSERKQSLNIVRYVVILTKQWMEFTVMAFIRLMENDC